VHPLERALHVVQVADDVGQDDVVERFVCGQVLDVVDVEGEGGVLPAGDLDDLRADVDTDAPGRFEGGEQVPRPAADLEHGGSRRDVEPDDPLDRFVVVPVLPLPPVGLRRLRVQQGHQGGFPGHRASHRTCFTPR